MISAQSFTNSAILMQFGDTFVNRGRNSTESPNKNLFNLQQSQIAKKEKRKVFLKRIGHWIGILQFFDDPRESANDTFNNIVKEMENYQLDIRNLTSIGAYNANVNFGELYSEF